MTSGGGSGRALRGALCFSLSVLAGCAVPPPDTEADRVELRGDLVVEARGWVERDGRAEACERLGKNIVELDDSGGVFEKRVMRTNEDKSYVFSDAVEHLPRAERRKTGIFFLLGFNQDRGRSPPIIERMAGHLRNRGFRAAVMPVPDRSTARQDAVMARDFLSRELPRVDRAILVGFSKGSSDLSEFWLGEAGKLPSDQLRKIRLWMNFAGVLRGSEVARWLACDRSPKAALYRAFVNLKSGRLTAKFDDLASISSDPWASGRRRMPTGLPRGFLVINVVAIPEGPEGWAESDPLFERLGRAAVSGPRPIGPCDGLVESAASTLPRQAGLRQWVVRIHGSHALLDGSYLNGSPVAPGYSLGGNQQLESGSVMMDDFLRALPESTLGM